MKLIEVASVSVFQVWLGTPSRDVLKCAISTPTLLTHNAR